MFFITEPDVRTAIKETETAISLYVGTLANDYS